MPGKDTIEMLIEGGKAAPGANTAPKFSSYKLNPGDIFKQINERTKDYAGMQVPVKVVVDRQTKAYEIVIGVPPTASLIKKEAGVALAKVTEEDKAKGNTVLGSLTMEQCVKVAKIKLDSLLAKDLKNALKQVVGTANSISGVMVEGRRPKDMIKEIDDGKWDSLLK